MHERATLHVREHGTVDRFSELGIREDHPATRAAQRLVRGGRHDLRVADRRGVLAGRDETGEVRHIDKKERLDRVGDLTEPREVEDARVRGGAGDDELRAILLRQTLELVVVEHLVLFTDTVGDEVVELAGEVHRGTVREMPALIQGEAQHGIAGLQHRGVRRHVRLGARVRLHVGVCGSKKGLRALDGERFRDVDPFTPAVVAAARIPLGIFVREYAADGLHDRGAGVILGSDELDLLDLTAPLVLDRGIDLGINALDEIAHFVRLF